MGYDKEAPYDRIIVPAKVPKLPEPLVDQLKEGGKIVLPINRGEHDCMYEITKNGGLSSKFLGHFKFVPLRGAHGYPI